jgi:arylsulfatase A-like enzyme
MLKIIKVLCASVGGLLLVALIFLAGWATLTIATYSQTDDQAHLQQKIAYLQSVAELPRDDLGYGDLGFTGSQAIATPTMNALAEAGVVMNNFYSPAPVCTPARAGFLTGRQALRAGIPDVVFPESHPIANLNRLRGSATRIPAEEITLADVLQANGYRTGMVGKWHLGDHSPSLPNDMGFQEFFGSLYSNDMTPFALYRNRDITIEAPADQTRLNEWYGDAAKEFISAGNEQPFFLYLAHNFPHYPLSRPAADVNRSAGGLYGDVVEGLDDVVAGVVQTLKQQGVYENTLILISSDNGPWYQGSPGSDRGRKGETFEGGMHVPMLVHWPEQIPGGRSLDGISMGTDWFPTILDWLELPLPQDRIIDGKSLRGMLSADEDSPNEYLFYFSSDQLMAVRDARYKYHGQRKYMYTISGSSIALPVTKGPWLFDADTDYNESYDISMLKTAEAERLQQVLDDKREEMIENPRGWIEPESD